MDPYAVADRLELAVHKGLVASDAVEPLDRVAALTRLMERVEQLRSDAVDAAGASGTAAAALGRALGVSRQAASRRLRRPSGRSSGEG